MRARHRHFNPRDAGADLVLDARYITQSDNTAVSSWADRSGNATDATQSQGANQPTFRTGQQGGNGGVDFDGSNDFLTGTYNPTGVPRTVHVTFKVDQTASTNTFFQVPQQVNSVSGGSGWLARFGQFSGNWNISGDAAATNQTLASAPSNATDPIIGTWSSDSSRNVSFFRDGTSLSLNGNPPNAANSIGTAGYIIGRVNVVGFIGQHMDGRIFSIHVWTGEQIATPIRKRLEHAAAFSFKIACN
jgi:hypothetical protein